MELGKSFQSALNYKLLCHTTMTFHSLSSIFSCKSQGLRFFEQNIFSTGTRRWRCSRPSPPCPCPSACWASTWGIRTATTRTPGLATLTTRPSRRAPHARPSPPPFSTSAMRGGTEFPSSSSAGRPLMRGRLRWVCVSVRFREDFSHVTVNYSRLGYSTKMCPATFSTGARWGTSWWFESSPTRASMSRWWPKLQGCPSHCRRQSLTYPTRAGSYPRSASH